MSTTLKRNPALTALAGVGILVAANALAKPSKTQSIAQGMRAQLDEHNSTVHAEHKIPYAPHPPDFIFFVDETSWVGRDTIMDRTELMKGEKKRKPWNMTYAEREAAE